MYSAQDVRQHDHRKIKGQLQKILPPIKQNKPNKERSDGGIGSNVSLNLNCHASPILAQVPQELSLEKIQSKDGFVADYLRVYCERVRQGDHFKTIKVHGGATAQKCLKEVVDMYYTKIGTPEQFQLFEVFGRIAPVDGGVNTNEPTLVFHEVKCRPIPPDETIHSIFSSTSPGSGLSRRIELRRRQPPVSHSPPLTNRSLRDGTNDIPTTPTAPLLRRSATPGGLRMTFRDSRSKRAPRGTRPPDGPYLLMLRGSQPQKDPLIYDLSSLIQKNGAKSEFTIGSSPKADICIHSAPGESSVQEGRTIFAKLVGYDQPLTVDGTNILTGAIYLEPAVSDWSTEDDTAHWNIPYTAINDELLIRPNNPFFKSRLLRPGDLVYFGSAKRGYIFLFKDPRWIPDHRLVLGLSAPKTGSIVEDYSSRVNGYTVNIEEKMHHTEKSSDTDSSNSVPLGRVEYEKRISGELIPRSVYLRQVISNLFTQPISTMASRHAIVDPFGAPNWSRIDPWRSAGLFAHLIRSTAQFVISPNPPAPNSDIDHMNPHAIQDYAINRLKDIHALLLECHQIVFTKGTELIYPNLWISSFCYDLAVLLSPGWLSSSGIGTRFGNLSTAKGDAVSADGSESSGSPRCSRRPEKSIENLPVVLDLRDCALQLADESIQVVVQIAFQEIAPYTTVFCQDYELPPASVHASRSGMTVQPHRIYYAELRTRLNKFASCLTSSLHPLGVEELDYSNSAGSSLFHTTSIDSSDLANDQLNSRSTKNRHQLMDSNDCSFSTGTESETGDMGVRKLRGSTDFRLEEDIRRTVCGGRTQTTEYRILAIIWRQLLAAISHHLLDVLLKTGTILIDWNTGERLLSGLTWLQEWLATNGLSAHRRPLSMISEFANLLATPKEQMLRMTWGSFRSMYPEIPPALLKFILKEYSIDADSVPYEAWSVDSQDETAANEDPFEVIQYIFDSWCAKERIQYQKTQQHSSPVYRPMEPRTFFGLSGTAEFIKRLDQQLEGQSTKFRWAGLVKQFSPPRVVTQPPSKFFNGPLNRPQSRQRSSGPRANRPGSGGQIDPSVRLPDATYSTVPRTTPTPIHADATARISRAQEMSHSKDTWNPLERQNGSYFPEYVKPAPSHGEPVRVIRSFSTEFQNDPASDRGRRGMNFMQSTPLHPAFSHTDLHPMNKQAGHLRNAIDRSQAPFELNRRMGSNLMYESQPNIHHLKDRQLFQQEQRILADQTSAPYKYQFGSHDFDSTYSPQSPHSRQLLSDGRLSHSMWQLSMNSYDGTLRNLVDSEFANNLNNISRDYEKFRMSLLGKGLDRLRSPIFESPAVAARNPLRGQTSQGLGTMHTTLPHSSYQTPNIIIEEAPGSHSSSGTNSIIGRSSLLQPRDDDLADVVSRTCQGNMVINVTLTRTPDISFGLVLVDGERTALDQPGVFVKSLTDNGIASQNGEINFGDRILAINGQDLTGMTYSEALKLLKACKTQATFTIRRCNLADPGLLLIPKINA